jgi:hypothetical protein
MIVEFKKAVRYGAKARVSLTGPGGSGKSLTMLRMARLLAGPAGRIAAADTEHGSLSKYAPAPGQPADNITTFDFDVIELDSYSPQTFIALLDAAEQQKMDVLCVDSLSHFWMGKDGALEFVDEKKKLARAKAGDQMDGWKEFRPEERKMLERILASPCHVLVTMRTKNEYRAVDYTTSDGKTKTKREKVGLAPVQRDGLEYEFDLCLVMTDENEALVDKTRCPSYRGKLISQPSAKDFQPFADWLKGAEPPAQTKPANIPEWRLNAKNAFGAIEQRIGKEAFAVLLAKYGYVGVDDIPSREIAGKVFRAVDDEAVFMPRAVAQEEKKPQAAPGPVIVAQREQPAADDFQKIAAGMTNMAGVVKTFQDLRAEAIRLTSEDAADTLVQESLGRHGVDHPSKLRSMSAARKCARELWDKIQAFNGSDSAAKAMVA